MFLENLDSSGLHDVSATRSPRTRWPRDVRRAYDVHPILPMCSDEVAEHEIAGSKAEVEELTG
jgi:hypothetical protein